LKKARQQNNQLLNHLQKIVESSEKVVHLIPFTNMNQPQRQMSDDIRLAKVLLKKYGINT